MSTLDPIRRRAHAERMLARAQRRRLQASKLIEKWERRLADLDREGVTVKQARLFADDQHEQGSAAGMPEGLGGKSIKSKTD